MLIPIFMTNSLMKKNNFYLFIKKNYLIAKIIFSNYSFFLLIIFSVLFSLNSCKEPDEIGLEQVTSQKLNVRFTDTTRIIAYAVKEDSIQTTATSLNLVGKTDDPIFGKTSAGFYTQYQLPFTDLTFGTNPVLDSMVLTLAYDGYYGDITKQQTINIYELSEDLDISKTYYSIDKKALKPVKVGTKTFYPRPKDSIIIDSVKTAPHLRITLCSVFADKFLYAQNSDLQNNTAFVKFFKGLYITADSNSEGNAMLYFNMASSLSRIKLYYHNKEIDSTFIYFYVNSLCPRFNSFNHHGYTSADSKLKKQIDKSDTSLGNQILYLQASGGIKTKILFPDLTKSYNISGKDNIAINKAELVIKPDIELSGDTSIYKIPSQLTILRLSSDNTLLIPNDYYVGTTYYGGTYNKTKNEYRFNISLYIQDLLNKKITTDKCLYLLADRYTVNANRVIISGPKQPYPNNIRLEMTYTKLGIKNK